MKNTLTPHWLLFALLCTLINVGKAQSLDSLRTDVFMPTVLTADPDGALTYSDVYTPSGSTWLLDFDESTVFKAELDYTHAGDPDRSYTLRIGKGGNVYSFRGVFGESVPPQFRPDPWVQPDYGGGSSYAPWVDEVWQMVAVDGALHNSPDSSYFIHQAGVYLKTPTQTTPFFSPMLAEHYDPTTQSYSCVNWGQQAHTEDVALTGFTSALLYYSRYTNVGPGIIQVDQMMYNFGDDNMSFINVPWGGVRHSNFGETFISNPDHSYYHAEGLYGATPVIQASATGGWIGWSNDINGQASALAIANTKSTVANGNVFRYGDAGNLEAAWNQRDYAVVEMIRHVAPDQLTFGTAMQFRYFFVIDETLDDVAATIADLNLDDLAFDAEEIDQWGEGDYVDLFVFPGTEGSLEVMHTDMPEAWSLAQQPFAASYPVFCITSETGGQQITSDPYWFSDQPWDGAAQDWKLLGFHDNEVVGTAVRDSICTGENYTLPDGSVLSNLMEDGFYVTTLPGAQGQDSVVFTHVEVLPLQAFYADLDGDGFGDATTTVLDCVSPPDYVSNSEDCNDADANMYPGAPGLENGVDANCNGILDGNEATLCPGDVVIDGAINTSDILSLLASLGCVGFCGSEDVNFDGQVGAGDLLEVLAVYGTSCW